MYMKLSKTVSAIALAAFVGHVYAENDAAAKPAGEVNLIRNGSFENTKPFCRPTVDYQAAKPFIGWDCLGGWFDHIQVSRLASDGNLSAQFSGGCWISRGVKVEEGGKHLVSGFLRTALPATPEQEGLGAYFEVRADGKTLLRRSLSGVHDWRKLEGEFTVPPGVKWIQIKIGGGGGGFTWADDFKVVKLKE